MNSRLLRLMVILNLAFLGSLPYGFAQNSVPDFETEIAPILIKRCVECHQPSNVSGGLSLTTRRDLVGGGESGAVLDLDSPQDSYLLQRIHDGEMPPEEKGKSRRLPDEEIELLQRWIAAGALWPTERQLDWFEQTNDTRAGRDWWSLQPIVRPVVPQLSKFPQPDNPIDAFVLARLERNGFSPATPADKRTLIRRLYYDLIGLPPTAEEIQSFVADESPEAWETLIDQLLQRPQYGERWARYWLDLARYADTSGYERDQEKPFAWKYRDWVVKAINEDLPFDQFVTEQIAGDEIANRTEQSLVATGFLRLGSWNDEPNDPADYTYERLEDLVHTTSSAFLGLTVKCARCHAHKFDPITQEDYYRMASAFWAGPVAARASKWLGGPTKDELGSERILAWTDLSADPAPIHLLKNGERADPLHEVIPASLAVVPGLERSFDPPTPGSKTTHRRLQLARWIADRANPLSARVFVNRLWQHHFGAGIVRTPNNFGFLADPPTHPQLLDWLAAEFMQNGGYSKPIHKLILTSRTWQQSSLRSDYQSYQQQDPSNRWWGHALRRRLDAEALRDSILAATGELDLTVGGEAFKPMIAPEALEGLSKKSAAYQASPRKQQLRRSLYMYLKRGLLPPMMSTFDLCDPTGSCGQRNVTTVPTQALALLNNAFIHQRSQQLAATILAGEKVETEQIRLAWLSVLRRKPTAQEQELASRHLLVQRKSFSDQETDAKVQDEASIHSSHPSLVVHLRRSSSYRRKE